MFNRIVLGIRTAENPFSRWGMGKWDCVQYRSKDEVSIKNAAARLQMTTDVAQKYFDNQPFFDKETIAPLSEYSIVWLDEAFADKSHLDHEGSGTVPVYIYHGYGRHCFKVVLLILATPFHLIGSILYNVLRIVPVILCLGMAAIAQIVHTRNNPSISALQILKDRGIDMLIQTGDSILNTVRAPFFALGYIGALLYALVDPLNGLKHAGIIEQAWNHGLSLDESFIAMTMKGPGGGDYFHFEGGGDPRSLGYHGFYLAGCMQVMGFAEYKNGEPQMMYDAELNRKGRTSFEKATSKAFPSTAIPCPEGMKICSHPAFFYPIKVGKKEGSAFKFRPLNSNITQ